MSDRAREVKVLILADAARQLDGAATFARVAVHELIGADLPGALDEAERALYEIAKASDMLRNQLRAIREEDEGGPGDAA